TTNTQLGCYLKPAVASRNSFRETRSYRIVKIEADNQTRTAADPR
ncbi:MAG: hypothetical protein V7643_3142, partial [Mycobacterium sp.]